MPAALPAVDEPESPRRRVSGIKSLVLTIAFVFLLIVAMLLDIPYLYIMAIALALLQPVSYLAASRWAPRFQATRHLPSTGVEGRPVPVEVEVDVSGGLPQNALAIRDTVPALWVDATTRTSGVLRDPDTWDGTRGCWRVQWIPTVRGVHAFSDIRLEATDPLGLFFFESSLACPGRIVVHPTPVLGNEPRQGGEGWQGVRERDGSARRGDGLEFHGVRDYRPGDPVRRVHWRTSARRGRLAVVEFEKAFQQDVCIVLDSGTGCRTGNGRDTVLEYLVKAAATLAEQALEAGGGVLLATSRGTCRVRAGEPDRDVARFRLFDLLARVEEDPGCDPAALLRNLPHGDAAEIELLTFRSESTVAATLAERVRSGDHARIVCCDPASFGGGGSEPLRVAGVPTVVLTAADSPWEEGGRRFLACLNIHAS